MKKLIVTGNVGLNPEVRFDTKGNEFVTFSLGVKSGTKEKPKTDWISVSCGGKLAEVAKNYVHKGSKLLIEGSPDVGAYINKNGEAAPNFKLYANNIELLSSKAESTENGISDSDSQHALNDVDISAEEIPF